MHHSTRSRLASIVLVAAGATSCAGLTPAQAAPARPEVSSISAALDNAGALVRVPQPVAATDAGLSTADGRVQLADDAAGAVRIADGAGAVSISLPGGADAVARPTSDGVVYDDVARGTDLVAAPTAEGAQLIAVLDSPSAPHRIGFDVDAGSGTALVPQADGSVSVVTTATTEGGSVITAERGTFEAPWAVDAAGVAVPTRYVIESGRLVQVVEATATTAYPVTADPSFKVTLFGIYIHWTRGEAKVLAGASLATVAAVVGVACAPTPYGGACAVAVPGIVSVLKGLSDAAIDRMYDSGYRVTTRISPPTLTYVEKR